MTSLQDPDVPGLVRHKYQTPAAKIQDNVFKYAQQSHVNNINAKRHVQQAHPLTGILALYRQNAKRQFLNAYALEGWV
jgi:hypothetical protein